MFTRLKVTLYIYTTNFFYKLARTRTYAYILLYMVCTQQKIFYALFNIMEPYNPY